MASTRNERAMGALDALPSADHVRASESGAGIPASAIEETGANPVGRVRDPDRPPTTPGPWVAIEVHERWRGSKPIFQDGLWEVLPEANLERLPICTVDRGDDNHPPARASAEADARLIAAAPDLLAACEEAEKFCPPHVQDRIRAAIEKAEGRS